MASGYLAIVLHAHLPFVRHPEYESFLEETWLFEAITEVYIPLLRVFENLRKDGVDFRITLSLSPPLLAMLQDDFLQKRYVAHLEHLSRLGDQEIGREHADPRLLEAARMYRRLLQETLDIYENQYHRDLVGAFGRLQDDGCLEIITAAATHGYLPILRTQPAAVKAQLEVGAESYRQAFNRPLPGFWLPECGYFPGLEESVREAGGSYFFVETHGIMNASDKPRYGYLAPLACPNGVAAFGRDPASGRQVWSANEGYPGDPWYRDFYKDIGFESDFDYIKPYILDGKTRVFTGFKYYRVTGDTNQKEPYEPLRARERAAVHADDFIKRQKEAIERYAPSLDQPPLIVALYDAELFGHWWFEGPQWLNFVIRKLASDKQGLELLTPSEYLERHPVQQCAQPSASSWGDKGYSDFWLNPGNDWIYRHLHDAAGRMQEVVRNNAGAAPDSLTYRALQQAARSLLLAQASDWAFIMKTGTAVDYAYGRTRDHLARFNYLVDAVTSDTVDEERLEALEAMDDIFPEINYRVFA